MDKLDEIYENELQYGKNLAEKEKICVGSRGA